MGKDSKPAAHKCPVRGSNTIIPVGRIHRLLKQGSYAPRISRRSAEYIAGVMEYLIREFIEEGGKVAKRLKAKRVTPGHLMNLCHMDCELAEFLHGVIFKEVGEVPKMPKGARAPIKRHMPKYKRRKAVKKTPTRKMKNKKSKKRVRFQDC